MRERLEKILITLGLSDKEAKVYLASTILGPATAQDIAAKATVNRPTTYVMIESLINRGLMSSHTRGKKRYFTAAVAEKLMMLIERDERKIAESRMQLQNMLSAFTELQKTTDNSEEGVVSVYEGVHAIKIWQDELMAYKGEVLEIVPVKSNSTLSLHQRPGGVRRIYFIENNSDLPKKNPNFDERVITTVNQQVDAEMSILVDKVAISTYAQEQKVIVLTGSRIAQTFIVMFNALWHDANPLT